MNKNVRRELYGAIWHERIEMKDAMPVRGVQMQLHGVLHQGLYISNLINLQSPVVNALAEVLDE